MYIIEFVRAKPENILLNTSMKVLFSQPIVEMIENLNWPRPRNLEMPFCQTKDFKIFQNKQENFSTERISKAHFGFLILP